MRRWQWTWRVDVALSVDERGGARARDSGKSSRKNLNSCRVIESIFLSEVILI